MQHFIPGWTSSFHWTAQCSRFTKTLNSHITAGFVTYIHTSTSRNAFTFMPDATNDPVDVTWEPNVRRYTCSPLFYGKVSECNHPYDLPGRSERLIFWTLLEVKPILRSRVSLITLYIWTPFVHGKTKHLLFSVLLLPPFSFHSPAEPSSLEAYSFGTENDSSTAEGAQPCLFTARSICGQG